MNDAVDKVRRRVMAGMDDEAIELAADWEGEEGRLACRALSRR